MARSVVLLPASFRPKTMCSPGAEKSRSSPRNGPYAIRWSCAIRMSVLEQPREERLLDVLHDAAHHREVAEDERALAFPQLAGEFLLELCEARREHRELLRVVLDGREASREMSDGPRFFPHACEIERGARVDDDLL